MTKNDRTIALLGDNNFKIIQNATVAVIGLGGVGGYAVESLARIGIKRLILVDYDDIDITNINRQIIATNDNIGLKKVDEFIKRINLIDPNIEIISLKIKLNQENYYQLFKYKFDYLIDACDDITAKQIIILECLKRNTKFIMSMGTGNKLHPELLEITELSKTAYDPIAKKLRKFVKENNIKDKIIVVSSKEKIIKKENNIVSSISFLPSVAGLLCTSYIINDILKNNSKT